MDLEALRELAQKVVRELGRGWVLDPDQSQSTWAVTIGFGPYKRIQFSVRGAARDRIVIQGLSRVRVPGEASTSVKEVTVDADRGHLAVVAAIRNKVLTGLEAAVGIDVRKVFDAEKAVGRCTAAVEALTETGDAVISFRGNPSADATTAKGDLRFGDHAKGYGSVTVDGYYDEVCVSFELRSLPLSVAREVVTSLRNYRMRVANEAREQASQDEVRA